MPCRSRAYAGRDIDRELDIIRKRTAEIGTKVEALRDELETLTDISDLANALDTVTNEWKSKVRLVGSCVNTVFF